MISVLDISWLAGLLEGEGSFVLDHDVYPTIKLASTDLDVVKRARNIMLKSKRFYIERRVLYKDRYSLDIIGNIAIQWMMTLYSLMGLRRKAKILEIINFWKNHHYPGSGHNRVGFAEVTYGPMRLTEAEEE